MIKILNYKELSSSQSPYLTYNEQSLFLRLLTQGVIDILNSPPLSPSDYDVYLIGPSASGDWTGYSNYIAIYKNNDWYVFVPVKGISLRVKDDDNFVVYNGSTWGDISTYIDHNQTKNYVAKEHIDWTIDQTPTYTININNIGGLDSDPYTILVDSAYIASLPVSSDGYIHVSTDIAYKAKGNAPVVCLSPFYVEPQVVNFQLAATNPTSTPFVYIDAYATGKPFITSDYGNTIYLSDCFIVSPGSDVFDVASYTIVFYAFKSGNFTVGQVVTGNSSGAYGTIVKEIITGTDTGMLMLRNESGVFQVGPPEVITDTITGSAYAGNVIYRNNQGFILIDKVTFSDVKSYGTIQDISLFNFIVLNQYFRQGWTLNNVFTCANADVFYRNPLIEITYSGQTPDVNFAAGSTITENITGATAVIYRDNQIIPTTSGSVHVTDVTGPFLNGNTFTNGSVTATIGSMSEITIMDISIFMALFEFNSSFIFLGYNLNGFYFNPSGIYLAASISGSPAIYAGGNFFKAGSLNGEYATIKVINCPPEKDSTAKINTFLETFDATITPYASTTLYSTVATSLNHTLHAELSERFKMEYWLYYITQTVNFTVGQVVTDNNTLTNAIILRQVDNGTSGYLVVDTLVSGIFAITQFASGGVGITRITATINTLKNNIKITIINSTNYNGTYDVFNVTGTTFDISKTYVAEAIVNQKWEFVYPMFNGNGVNLITDSGGGSAVLNNIESHIVYTGIENINVGIFGRLNVTQSTGTNVLIRVSFAKNDVLINRTNEPIRVATSGVYQAAKPMGLISLVQGDYLEYYVQNISSSANILCNSANTVVMKV